MQLINAFNECISSYNMQGQIFRNGQEIEKGQNFESIFKSEGEWVNKNICDFFCQIKLKPNDLGI
jgi:hypothetical protein